MKNSEKIELEEKEVASEDMKLEANKPLGGVRSNKKVTLEIDIEKTLKFLILFGVAVILVIYGYKGGRFIFESAKALSHPAYQIAVLDMPALRKEFNIQNGNTNSASSKTNFEKYFKALMKVYRERGYLVIDATLAVTIPDNVEIVTYIDLDGNFDAVQSGQSNANESEGR
ncbi:transcriptional regulator [Photorhabdus tasmaniensis]